MFSNAAFMGFPIIAALFGNSAVLLASVSRHSV
jgi:predicted permease